MRAQPIGAAPEAALPDALLVNRIAALSDRAALAELDARHGMRLYAIAYGLVFDSQAADAAVAAAFRELWRSAAALDTSAGSVASWLADFTRRAVRDHRGGHVRISCSELSPRRILAAAPVPVPRHRLAAAFARVVRVAAVVGVISATLLG
jgi:DNA-directed RNA polymerase specialized sigma24 family protein